MNDLFLINEEEKNRILGMHETATKKHYLSEQPTLDLGQPTQPEVGPQNLQNTAGTVVKKGLSGDPYVYAKLGNDYYYAKASDGDYPNWVLATNLNAVNSIKGKIYDKKVPVVKTVKAPEKGKTKVQPKKTTTTPKTTTKPTTTTNVPGKDKFKLKRDVRTFDVDSTRVGNGRDKRIMQPGKSVVKTPQEEKSLFDRITSGVKQFVTNAVSFVVPIHYRIFYDFLSLRKKPFVATDMSDEEQKALRQMIQYGLKHGYKIGKNFDFYDISNKLNNGSEKFDFKNKENLGLNQFNLKSEYTKLSMTLGNATVKQSGNYYIVTDIYDFNNYKNNPEKYTLKEVPNTVKDSIKKVASGNLVQGVEQMASYYQKLGYEGFPVKIEIPV
jgi:hypothetical protein